MKTTFRRLLCAFVLIVMTSFNAAYARTVDFVPLPKSVNYTEGEFVMNKQLKIYGGEQFNVSYLQEHLNRVFDFTVPVAATRPEANIQFNSVKTMGVEDYTITVLKDRIIISSGAKAGEFYAIQTLLQMMPAGVYNPAAKGPYRMLLKEWSVPCCEIADSPRFAYRGSMFDISRTFFDKEFMLRHLDYMAYHKINKLHWHLVDDNGWRIEIKKYPKLTQVGAWRGKDEALPPAYNSGPDSYGGYLTQEEIKEIVAYATQRNIEIIPEIDLPGHSKSIAVSYPEILCSHDEDVLSVQGESKNVFCVAKENNYRILENIMKEVASLFPSRYICIGGDEVATDSWKYCKDCQALMKKMGYENEKQLMQYFVERMEKICAKYGKKIAGWDDITVGNISRDNMVMAWRGKKAGMNSVSLGFPTVMQIGEFCYIDMKYSLLERGHTWAAIVSMEKIYSFDPVGSLDIPADKVDKVLGPQAGLWTEMLFFPPHFAEYQMFPRLCALSEIGWTPQEKRQYTDFDRRLDKSHFERMLNMGIRFRIPYPKMDVVEPQQADGCWKVNASAPYDNMVVRYTTDGTTPTLNSPVVNGTIFSNDPQNLRFATFFADLSSITIDIPQSHKYLTPVTRVTSSCAENKSFPMSNLEKYEFRRYMRTAKYPVEGDWILYTFESPVECGKITVQTNDPINQFFGIAEGHVEISYDGSSFEKCDTFNMYNRVVVDNITRPVHAVKIVVDGPGEYKAVSVQCLKIEK